MASAPHTICSGYLKFMTVVMASELFKLSFIPTWTILVWKQQLTYTDIVFGWYCTLFLDSSICKIFITCNYSMQKESVFRQEKYCWVLCWQGNVKDQLMTVELFISKVAWNFGLIAWPSGRGAEALSTELFLRGPGILG